MRAWAVAVVVLGVAVGVPAGAQDRIILEEVLGSWQGDLEVQLVELRMVSDGQQAVGGRGELVFDDATASEAGRRFVTLPRDVARGVAGARILVATNKAVQVAGVTADFALPSGFLRPAAGRVCWQAMDGQGAVRVVDCLAWGAFEGGTFGFGPATRLTPENRSLQRTGLNGVIRKDWEGVLQPTPENNAGAVQTLATLCGNGSISQGEQCDGAALGGATCASLGFARGKLACTQCRYDTGKCSFCGNGEVNGKEACDGAELGGRTCEALGFTGGTLACSDGCVLDTAGCADTFLVPGAGAPKSDCQAEWRVRHGGAKPDGTGKAPPRLTCRDGDAACDGGTAAGSCTIPLAVCFGAADERLAACAPRATASWTLAAPAADDANAAALLAAVAAAAPGSTTGGGTVTFGGDGVAPGTCSAVVEVTVPVRAKLRLKSRAVAAGGRPRDPDTLRVACVP